MRRNFGDIVALDGDSSAPALIDLSGSQGARTFSFADLDAGADGVARGLHRRGFSHGDAIGILAENSREFLICHFGAMRAGLVSVPINTRLPAPSVEFICRDAQLCAVFAGHALRASCPAELPCFELEPRAIADFVEPGAFDSVSPRERETALIVYTSGSTGRPKGVVLSHAGQWAGIDAIADNVRQAFRGRRAIVAAPLFHVNGLGFCATMLSVAGSVVLLPRFRADAFIDAIGKYRVDIVTGLPTMLARIAAEESRVARADLSSVGLVFVGSAPLTDTVVRQAERLFPGAVLSNGYGTTETGGGIFGNHPGGLPLPRGSLGHPAAHVEVRLVGGTSADTGVLEVRSPAAMTGYHNLPELTAECLRDGWFHTGDVMRRDADGFHFFVGRDDDMFVCSGENVHPGELERVLDGHPDIVEACVVPLDDAVRGQVPVAFVVPREGAELTERDVREFVLAHAAAHLHPRRVFFLEEMPLAGTHKIDRRALARRLEARDRSAHPD